jgi:hypothetical protein
MLTSLLKMKIKKALATAAQEYEICPKVQEKIFKDLEKDYILPDLHLHGNTKVKFSVTHNRRNTQDCVLCQIGPRDWQWNFRSGVLEGCGTFLG